MQKYRWSGHWFERMPLTREGLFWFLIASAMLVTGLLKSINLITLLACFLVVLVGWNYLLARRQLRGLRAGRLIHEPIFAQTPYRWQVQLKNLGKRPAHEIRIQDGAGEQPPLWFVPEVAAGASLILYESIVLPRRGRLPGRSLALTCGYPLGLAQLTNVHEPERDVIVLPRLGRLQQGVLRRLLGRQSPSSGQAKGRACHLHTAQAEFHGLRPYRPGDSPRHIHWRTSARRDELMVREFEELPNDNLVLIVEAWRAIEGDDLVLERTLSVAATIVWEWCRQKGDRLAVLVAGSGVTGSKGVTGRTLALEILERLAMEGGGVEIDGPELIGQLSDHELPSGPMLVVSSRGSELAGAIAQALHRKVASVDVTRCEESLFFDG